MEALKLRPVGQKRGIVNQTGFAVTRQSREFSVSAVFRGDGTLLPSQRRQGRSARVSRKQSKASRQLVAVQRQ
ncbi:MAG: hypothetical protein PsegKO_12280 [Pseudohongiellaceae bacterium]